MLWLKCNNSLTSYEDPVPTGLELTLQYHCGHRPETHQKSPKINLSERTESSYFPSKNQSKLKNHSLSIMVHLGRDYVTPAWDHPGALDHLYNYNTTYIFIRYQKINKGCLCVYLWKYLSPSLEASIMASGKYPRMRSINAKCSNSSCYNIENISITKVRFQNTEVTTHRFEQKVSTINLGNETAHRPQIRWEGPTQLQRHLWAAILPRVHNARLTLLCVVRCTSEINHCYNHNKQWSNE